jgi:hypothetical protein
MPVDYGLGGKATDVFCDDSEREERYVPVYAGRAVAGASIRRQRPRQWLTIDDDGFASEFDSTRKAGRYDVFPPGFIHALSVASVSNPEFAANYPQ